MLTNPAHSTRNPRLQAELDFLYGRINYEQTTRVTYPRHYKLESMRQLLKELGNPQNQYAIIHVAGTKGKGSVCKMISGALNAAGILTGVYSSPHIESIRERITLGGRQITEDQLAESLERTRLAVQVLDEKANGEGCRKNSFFEMITATALLYFQNRNAKKVVLEVGLGGRLDSTNICEPELCVITNISLDHTLQLGTTVDRIAREKAGIIKPGVVVVSGVSDPLAAREIHETCSVCNSDLMEIDQDFHFRINQIDGPSQSIRFETWGMLPERHSYHLQDIVLKTVGQHQVSNAAIAIAAINLLTDRFHIPQNVIRKSLAVFKMIGRCEVLVQHPLIVVDMAHNVASIQALVDMLARLRPNPDNTSNPSNPNLSNPIPQGKRKLVFASSCDKDLQGMLARLLPWFDEVIFTRFVENPRATEPLELVRQSELTQESGVQAPKIQVAADPQEAWKTVSESLIGEDLLCVAGSAFLVAEMRPMINRHFS